MSVNDEERKEQQAGLRRRATASEKQRPEIIELEKIIGRGGEKEREWERELICLYNSYVRVNLLCKIRPKGDRGLVSWGTESGKAGPLALNFRLVLFE